MKHDKLKYILFAKGIAIFWFLTFYVNKCKSKNLIYAIKGFI